MARLLPSDEYMHIAASNSITCFFTITLLLSSAADKHKSKLIFKLVYFKYIVHTSKKFYK